MEVNRQLWGNPNASKKISEKRLNFHCSKCKLKKYRFYFLPLDCQKIEIKITAVKNMGKGTYIVLVVVVVVML